MSNSVYTGEANYISQYFYGEENGSSPDFVIPDYQREYSWSDENVRQLFSDVLSGVKSLSCKDLPEIKKEQKSKFLGCIIQWNRKAKENQDFHPSVGNNLYVGSLREIIDGQQRTSTLLVLFVRYYYYFENSIANLNSSDTESILKKHLKREIQKKWLLKRFSKSIPATSLTRPVLIRQDSDLWGDSAESSRYRSPISRYLYDAINAIETEKSEKILHDIEPDKKGSSLSRVVKAIDESIASAFCDDDYFCLNESYNVADLFNDDFIEDCNERNIDIINYITHNEDRANVIKPIINNIAVLHYLLNYCAFTVISSPTENAALDMFQSLNSTGVQLTALQMLKPSISSQYKKNNVDYINSETNDIYKDINDWFNDNPKTKERKTKQFFHKFCMLMKGELDPNSLSVQRNWLKECFEHFTKNQNNTEKTDEFISIIKSTVEYIDQFIMNKTRLREVCPVNNTYSHYSLKNASNKIGPVTLSDDCIASLMYLSDSNHDLHHPLLIMFYHKARLAKNDTEFKEKVCDFQKIVKAATSIFTLYRVGLDKHPDGFYKKLYKHAFSFTTNKNLNVSAVVSALREELYNDAKQKFGEQFIVRKFLDSFSTNCRYNKLGASVLRFILILNTHKKIPNPKKIGLQISNVKGPEYLTPNIWMNKDTQSIEHICPQSAERTENISCWGSQFVSSTKIHSIGNLTLLSLGNNASVSEDTESKLNAYSSLISNDVKHPAQPKVTENSKSTPTQHHLTPIVERLNKWIKSSESGKPNANYAWSPKFVDKRSLNISSLVIKDLITSLTLTE